jgi:hypothetical protein
MSNDRQATEGWARFSRDGRHRLLLGRLWDDALPTVAFVGLNPSTADATTDDATIRRCIGFARSWGFGSLLVANLYTFCATDPRDLEAWGDRLAFGADHALRDAANEAALVIEAWGAHPLALRRADHVQRILEERADVGFLGLTKSGAPRHPLYVPGETLPTLVGGRPARLPVAQRGVAPSHDEGWVGDPLHTWASGASGQTPDSAQTIDSAVGAAEHEPAGDSAPGRRSLQSTLRRLGLRPARDDAHQDPVRAVLP